MTRAIAVGVDGSPASGAAVDWAAGEASLRGLPLRIVHAPWWEPRDFPVLTDDVLDRAAEAVLSEARERAVEGRPSLEVTTEVLADAPVPALLRTAGEAGTLVLGSRAQGALLGFLLGSHGQQVIAHTTRPVVSVRASGDDGAPGRTGEVVVGQRGEARDSDPALGFAFEAAAAHGAPLRAVRAWHLPSPHAFGPEFLRRSDAAGGPEALERKALREVLAPWRERFPGVEVVEHVEMGSAGQVLLSVAGGARLLVVGRRARYTPTGGLIGSVAHAALHHARCPVAVIPHE
ncbi:universal stress protein [Streptomyces sp. JNUCC 64]